MDDDFKIEKGVPLRGRDGGVTAALRRLAAANVGDSIFFPKLPVTSVGTLIRCAGGQMTLRQWAGLALIVFSTIIIGMVLASGHMTGLRWFLVGVNGVLIAVNTDLILRGKK